MTNTRYTRMLSQMITLEPIGTVRNGIAEAHHDTPWPEIESSVILQDRWSEALEGLEEFSHIWVIFYFDRMTAEYAPRVRPMRRADLPLVGVLATRSPQRPNRIGMSVVELLQVRGSTLRVRGLEALDGSPVLDIKPYIGRRDALANTRTGEWVKLWETDAPEEK